MTEIPRPAKATIGGDALSAAMERALAYPRLRFMGSKHRLLPWIVSELARLSFTSVLDGFSGSGCVAYALKSLGKRVTANDALLFASTLARASVENAGDRLTPEDHSTLTSRRGGRCAPGFIEETFAGIFFEREDLRYLDRVWDRLPAIVSEHRRAIVIAALVRACMKRQPRGVFTVAGDPERYKDGRRDLRLSIEEHFRESIDVFNALPFASSEPARALQGDVFAVEGEFDLVYLDPPYVPRADDNCYVKRYHFLEGLASRWTAPGTEIIPTSKVRKIAKRHTPFSYRSEAIPAFERLFDRFRRSIVVLSYSSNGYPDLEELVRILRAVKRRVRVVEREHRYHFGTHARVATERAKVREYLVIGE